jgi:hypothetical protein
MTTEEIRAEWCKMKGFNYIDFDTLKEAEEYILFLESKIKALNIAGVVKRSFTAYDNTGHARFAGMASNEEESIQLVFDHFGKLACKWTYKFH